METIKVLIADDSSLVCAGLSELLQKEHDIEIVGNIHESARLSAVHDLRADVLLLCSSVVAAEDVPGLALEFKKRSPHTRILLVLQEDTPDSTLMQYLTTGVEGYVRRTAALRQLIDAVRTVHAGDIWAERKLLNKFVALHPLPASAIAARFSRIDAALTKREQELVSLLLLGLSNKALSGKLGISETTVKTHLNNIFKKLKVGTRTELVSSLMHASHTKALAS